jgi:hypothetical protein
MPREKCQENRQFVIVHVTDRLLSQSVWLRAYKVAQHLFTQSTICIPTTFTNLVLVLAEMKATLPFALAIALMSPRSVSAWGTLGHQTTG